MRARERPSPEPSGSASGSASASPSVLDLPCRRARPNDPTSWPLSAAQVESWQVVFPTMDVLGEARKAKAWLEANPSNAKTVRGMLRFLFGWLERSSNSGRFVKREGGAALASAPSGEPDAPEREWLEKRYGRESFAQWEEQLRHSLRKYPDALPGMLEDLAAIRREWEAYRDRAAEVSHAA